MNTFANSGNWTFKYPPPLLHAFFQAPIENFCTQFSIIRLLWQKKKKIPLEDKEAATSRENEADVCSSGSSFITAAWHFWWKTCSLCFQPTLAAAPGRKKSWLVHLIGIQSPSKALPPCCKHFLWGSLPDTSGQSERCWKCSLWRTSVQDAMQKNNNRKIILNMSFVFAARLCPAVVFAQFNSFNVMIF